MTVSDDPVTAQTSEYLAGITFQNSILFTVNATTNSLPSSYPPDFFSIYLFQSDGYSSLTTTTDPSQGNSILTVNIDGTVTGSIHPYSVTNPPNVSVTVLSAFEPASIALAARGVAGLLGLCRRIRRC